MKPVHYILLSTAVNVAALVAFEYWRQRKFYSKN